MKKYKAVLSIGKFLVLMILVSAAVRLFNFSTQKTNLTQAPETLPLTPRTVEQESTFSQTPEPAHEPTTKIERSVASESSKGKNTIEENLEEVEEAPKQIQNQEKLDEINQPIKPEVPAFKRYTKAILSPTFSYARIDAEDKRTSGNATIGSDLIYGVIAHWIYLWSDSFRSFVSVSLSRFSTLRTDDARTIANSTATYSGLGLGVENDLSDNLVIGGAASTQQEIYIRSVDSSGITLDKVNIPEIEVFSRYTFIPNPSPLHLGIEGRAKILFPTNRSTYKTNLGQSYTAKLFFEQVFKSFNIGVDVFYSQQNYSSSIVSQSRSDAGLMFHIGWEIGK